MVLCLFAITPEVTSVTGQLATQPKQMWGGFYTRKFQAPTSTNGAFIGRRPQLRLEKLLDFPAYITLHILPAR